MASVPHSSIPAGLPGASFAAEPPAGRRPGGSASRGVQYSVPDFSGLLDLLAGENGGHASGGAAPQAGAGGAATIPSTGKTVTAAAIQPDEIPDGVTATPRFSQRPAAARGLKTRGPSLKQRSGAATLNPAPRPAGLIAPVAVAAQTQDRLLHKKVLGADNSSCEDAANAPEPASQPASEPRPSSGQAVAEYEVAAGAVQTAVPAAGLQPSTAEAQPDSAGRPVAPQQPPDTIQLGLLMQERSRAGGIEASARTESAGMPANPATRTDAAAVENATPPAGAASAAGESAPAAKPAQELAFRARLTPVSLSLSPAVGDSKTISSSQKPFAGDESPARQVSTPARGSPDNGEAINAIALPSAGSDVLPRQVPQAAAPASPWYSSVTADADWPGLPPTAPPAVGTPPRLTRIERSSGESRVIPAPASEVVEPPDPSPVAALLPPLEPVLAVEGAPQPPLSKQTASRVLSMPAAGETSASAAEQDPSNEESPGETGQPSHPSIAPAKGEVQSGPPHRETSGAPPAPVIRTGETADFGNAAAAQQAVEEMRPVEAGRPLSAAETPANFEQASELQMKPAPVVRALEFQLQSDGGRVAVRVADRAGEVTVDVRTPEAGLAGALRADLPDLAARIEQTGYHAEIWHPMPLVPGRWPTAESGAAPRNLPGQPTRENGQGQNEGRRDSTPFQQPAPRKQIRKDFQWLFNSIR